MERTGKLDATQIHDEQQEQRENNGQDIDNYNRQEYEDLNENTTKDNNKAANELTPEDLDRAKEITQVAKKIYKIL